MNTDEITLLAIKGAISELSPEEQTTINKLVHEIKTKLKDYQKHIGMFAISFIGAEMVATIKK